METTADAAPLNAPTTISSLVSAAKGDPSGLWFLSLMAKMAFPESFVWGELAAMGRADTLAAKRYFAGGPHRKDSILGNPGTEFLYAGGGLIDAWPATPDENEYATVRDSNVETLLVGGTLDFATPAVNATRRAAAAPPERPPGRPLRARSQHLVLGRAAEGEYAPAEHVLRHRQGRYVALHAAKVDFTPDVTPHRRSARASPATLYGLPVIALLSLLLMWRRSRKRGRIGRTASVLLRSVFTLVLGLAGWFGGVVVVLVAFPTRAARRPRSSPSSRSACRSPLGSTSPGSTAPGGSGSVSLVARGRARRRLGRVPGRNRAAGRDHNDHRSGPRREPAPPRPRHLGHSSRRDRREAGARDAPSTV